MKKENWTAIRIERERDSTPTGDLVGWVMQKEAEKKLLTAKNRIQEQERTIARWIRASEQSRAIFARRYIRTQDDNW
tara:strand:- start:945 stop:1175 length:231 start_codon:yes stop_codon:yes gene_type:complete